MCGIAGWIDFKQNLLEQTKVLEAMRDALSRRGPDEFGLYLTHEAGLAHRRLAIIDVVGGKQPMTKSLNGTDFTLIYNGELYNTSELRNELSAKGHSFFDHSDTEVLLTAFLEWGEKCLLKLNGTFAFAVWNQRDKKLFCARDTMGTKPLFYKLLDDGIIFASEIKSLFQHPHCPSLLDNDGINQMFLLGPGRISGSGVYKGIEELKPAEYFWFDSSGLKKTTYFHLKAQKHTQSLSDTSDELRFLVMDAIKRQLVSDVPLACFLSGGLDSSIISYVAAEAFKKENKQLTTFSVDFKDNQQNFVSSVFQPEHDLKYINIMSEFLGSNHHQIILENHEVVDALHSAALARDLPGMADVDSSLLLFCNKIKDSHTVCLSGECADEFFGGYPWFFQKDLSHDYEFPWGGSLNMRQSLLKGEYQTANAQEFIKAHYQKTIEQAELLDDDTEQDKFARQMFMLNTTWFMQTLVDRKDRMSMFSAVKARVPFCDHRLAQYAYNIPWHFKAYKGREKGLLRQAFSGILPDQIVYRKKSPYPKSFDKDYFYAVKELAIKALDSGGLISELLDRKYFDTLLDLPPEQARPWYGQLMRLPQVFGFLVQMDYIFSKYNVNLSK